MKAKTSSVVTKPLGDSNDLVYSRHSFGRVLRLGVNVVVVQNEAGREWTIDRPLFDAEFTTAGPHGETSKEVSRTEMLQLILANAKTAMTVTFRKKVEAKDVSAGLREFLSDGQEVDKSCLDGKRLEKKVKELLEGEVRTMSGYHHSGQLDEHGRLHFVSIGEGPRQVDPRTVEQLTLGGVTYQVRG